MVGVCAFVPDGPPRVWGRRECVVVQVDDLGRTPTYVGKIPPSGRSVREEKPAATAKTLTTEG